MIEVSAFACSYCAKLFKSKSGATRHEKTCPQNPINHRPCFSCGFLKEGMNSIYIGVDHYYTGEPIYEERKFLYCSKLNKGVYPPKVERNIKHHGGAYELEAIPNEAMPKTCNSYKDFIEVPY